MGLVPKIGFSNPRNPPKNGLKASFLHFEKSSNMPNIWHKMKKSLVQLPSIHFSEWASTSIFAYSTRQFVTLLIWYSVIDYILHSTSKTKNPSFGYPIMVLHYSERGIILWKRRSSLSLPFLPLYMWFQVCVKRDEGWNSVEFQFEILWCWSPWQRNKGRLLLIIIAWTQQALLSWQVDRKTLLKSRNFSQQNMRFCSTRYLFRVVQKILPKISLFYCRFYMRIEQSFIYFPISTNFTT